MERIRSILQQLAVVLVALCMVLLAQTFSGVAIIGTRLGAQGGSGDVVGPSSAVNGQLAAFNGTTGKLLAAFAGTGMYRFASGIPTLITGSPSDCVRVDGTSGACGSGGGSVTAGDGINVASGVVSVDTSVPAIVIDGSQSLTFGTIASGTEVTQTLTVAGAAIGDKVAVSLPPTLPTGVYMTAFVSATNTLTIRLFKGTTGSADVTGLTFGYQILRSR